MDGPQLKLDLEKDVQRVGSLVSSSGNTMISEDEATTLVQDYLVQHCPEHKNLAEMKSMKSENPEQDAHFAAIRERADNRKDYEQEVFWYELLKATGTELDSATGILSAPANGHALKVLDLCMAPGGFTSVLLSKNPTATAHCITLPVNTGGNRIWLPRYQLNKRLRVELLDLTMLIQDFGLEPSAIPQTHPEADNFVLTRPFADTDYDLVLCDGHVLRTHKRHEYRTKEREVRRLENAELVVALNRAKEGGTIVMLLHSAAKWHMLQLINLISRFAEVELVKMKTAHVHRGSFYLVVRHVRPRSPFAVMAVAKWCRDWYVGTFGSEEDVEKGGLVESEEVERVLLGFGEEYVRLGTPVWRVQGGAFRGAKMPVRGGDGAWGKR